MIDKKGLLFYYDWLQPLTALSDTDFKAVVCAMITYSLEDSLPGAISPLADMALGFIIPQIKRIKENVQNGALGGRPKKSSKAKATENEKVSEAKEQESGKDVEAIYNNKEETNTAELEGVATPPTANASIKKGKDVHGEFNNVYLSKEEFEDIKARFPWNYKRRINDLSYYIQAKGDKYESHYGAILNWSRNQENKSDKDSDSSAEDFFNIALAASEREMHERLNRKQTATDG